MNSPPFAELGFSKRRLIDALDGLAELSGASIVLDGRVWQQAQTRVTGQFSEFKVEAAVRVLADMAGLKSVLIDNVIYVTSPENVRQFKNSTRPLPFSRTLDGEQFKSQTLSDILDSLVHTNLAIDPRIEKKTKMRITAKFINAVELETALRVLLDMAALSYVVVDDIVYITSPENACKLEAEQTPKMPKAEDMKLNERSSPATPPTSFVLAMWRSRP